MMKYLKILSQREYEFLINPEKFNKDYQYVLTHRIKKKLCSMENTISFIKAHYRSLMPNKNKERYDVFVRADKWHEIVINAMNKMSEDKDRDNKKDFKKAYELFCKEQKSIDDVDKWNESLYKYQRKIVEIYMGKEYLKFEAHKI